MSERDTKGVNTTGAPQTATNSWDKYFGHEAPYTQQRDGIETIIDTVGDRGFVEIEGACGTGKTMMALTAAIKRVRKSDQFNQIFVLTSVKQQIQQFEEDLQTINDQLPAGENPVSGLTLVGKKDVCLYSATDQDATNFDDSAVYGECDALRENTRTLLSGDVDPEDLADLGAPSRALEQFNEDEAEQADVLEVEGVETEYGAAIPQDGGQRICPGYAKYLDMSSDDNGNDLTGEKATPFDTDSCGHVTMTDLLQKSAAHGVCPHSVMGELMKDVEVVVGNYYHAFDPLTHNQFTAPLLNENTLVVCDEAHMLEERVRDLLAREVEPNSFKRAIGELNEAVAWGLGDKDEDDLPPGTSAKQLRSIFDSGPKQEAYQQLSKVFDSIADWLDTEIPTHLDTVQWDWRDNPEKLTDHEIALDSPTEPKMDGLSEHIESEFDKSDWARAIPAAVTATNILEETADYEREVVVDSAAKLLTEWMTKDHTEYFRKIDIEATPKKQKGDDWRAAVSATLTLYDCIPAREISSTLDEFGGGVLMSATLQPFDVFERASGLTTLEDERDRRVERRTYDLAFPEENRLTLAVSADKFTASNRQDTPERPETSLNTTRAQHLHTVSRIVSDTPGNVLIGMPSYAEAEWIGSELEARGLTEKPILVDESSSTEDTDALKQEFFTGEPKVLITGMRGTLTEGVDFDGDKLAACAIVGVPIASLGSPTTKAVKNAYDNEFELDGFESSLTVPAVRKARQTMGRVIRGEDEVGVRALIDDRYASSSWNDVREFFPESTRREMTNVSPDMMDFALGSFDWE